MIKKILISVVLLIALVVGTGYWFIGLIGEMPDLKAMESTQPSSVAYLQRKVDTGRGNILIVVTSATEMGESGKKTGYELTELSRAYYVFSVNGFEVDIASPKGGEPSAIIDDEDMTIYDFAFLNDVEAQQKVKHTIKTADVQAGNYAAVYFVGGKGAMFDFPQDEAIQAFTASIYEAGGTVSAVCHGPAALVNVQLSDGSYLIANKQVSSFTNEEELFLIPDAEVIFPFLLEDKLRERQGVFVGGTAYLQQVSKDERLLTGQNPWSVWKVAEDVIRSMGYEPVQRDKTSTEFSIDVLKTYEQFGFETARTQLQQFHADPGKPIDKVIIGMHSILAVMNVEPLKALDLALLLQSIQ